MEPENAGGLGVAVQRIVGRVQHDCEACRNAGWQPIETAPKDGSYILLGYADSHSEEGRWVGEASRNHWGEIGWFASDADVLCDRPTRPDYWQPMPTPPALAPATKESTAGELGPRIYDRKLSDREWAAIPGSEREPKEQPK